MGKQKLHQIPKPGKLIIYQDEYPGRIVDAKPGGDIIIECHEPGLGLVRRRIEPKKQMWIVVLRPQK